VREAIAIARQCRTLLGANGITLEYPVMRHANNLESVLTYEGTSEVHQMIIGQAVTGHSAFPRVIAVGSTMQVSRELRIVADAGIGRGELTEVPIAGIGSGELLLRASHSSVNYKDTLAATGGTPPVARP
jgi:hypothetical protein